MVEIVLYDNYFHQLLVLADMSVCHHSLFCSTDRNIFSFKHITGCHVISVVHILQLTCLPLYFTLINDLYLLQVPVL